MTTRSIEINGGCCGCITSIILLIIVGWALVFGVTWGVRHYGLKTCTAKDGVAIDRN